MLELSPDKLDLDDKKTWDLICSGRTKGIFQLETPLGRSYAKKIQPRSIEELSDLITVVRPGCLEAKLEDGKTITHHYIERKHGREEVTFFHPSLEEILKPTYGMLCYQEQAIEIVKKVGGFTLEESESFRKAVGKKLADEMAKNKKLFLEKAITTGVVNEEEAVEIFSWIEKSQRYSFNKSHGVAYAMGGYVSAYLKAHYPLEFFTAWLKHSDEKMKTYQEIGDLINEAKFFDIEIQPPNLIKSENNFAIVDGKIYYGLANIKGLGKTAISKIRMAMVGHLDSWVDFLLNVGYDNYSSIKALASVGALPFKLSRTHQLFDLDIINKLSGKELAWCKLNQANDLGVMIENLAKSGVPSKIRLDKLKDLSYTYIVPPYSLTDDVDWISRTERDLLGLSLTCNQVDSRNTMQANCSCLEFSKSKQTNVVLAVTLNKVKEFTIKAGKNKGQKMCFLTISDGTAEIDGTMFGEAFGTYGSILEEGINVLVIGVRSKKDSGLIINKVIEI